ncbi:MAG TPA: hypothetical protein VJO53_04925 [Candidatus Acidoferrales bacterium]|nr:hypothetical protein [Candidatus Acidoferrales bacterium]
MSMCSPFLPGFSGVRTVLFILPLVLAAAVTGSQVKHWTETPSELLWRGRYKNCDKGYLVNLPAGVIAHGSRPPNPNHGVLISAKIPGATTEVTLEDPRLVDVYDTNDAGELGSAQAYLEEYELRAAKASEKITILEKQDIQFRGSPAVYVHFRKTDGGPIAEVEELVVYRKHKEIGPLFHIVLLRTTPEAYSRDHALFLQIKEGLEFITVPKGECSND